MKKFYLFFCLFLSIIGTTLGYAQVVYATFEDEPLAKDAITDGVYVIKCYAEGYTGVLYDTNESLGSEDQFKIDDYGISNTNVTSLKALWKVTKNGDGKITLQNATGYGLPIATTDGRFTGTNDTGSLAQFTLTDCDNSASLFVENSFTLHQDNQVESDYLYVHVNVWYGVYPSYWHGVNVGSDQSGVLFAFYKADISSDALTAVINNYSSISSNSKLSNASDYVGGYSLSDAQTAWDKFKSDVNYETLSSTLEYFSQTELQENMYYLIKSKGAASNKAFMSSEDNTADTDGNYNTASYITRKASSDLIIPMLWKIESVGDNLYKFLNVNAQKYMGEYVEIAWSNNEPNNGIRLSTTDDGAGSYAILQSSSSSTEWLFATSYVETLSSTTDYINAFGGKDEDVIGGYSSNTYDEGGNGNYWYIIPVTTFDFSINTTSHWASAKFPFAVEMPQGLKAYTAVSQNAAGTQLNLEEISGQIIPANEAVFIEDATDNKTGSYTLTIAYDNTNSKSNNNLLDGTTLTRTGYTENELYLLTRTDEGSPILRRNSSSVSSINPNKAYYRPTTQNAEQIQFCFGGTKDGISSITNNHSECTIYYDLNGRFVPYPTTGIYITDDGKKVFIK